MPTIPLPLFVNASAPPPSSGFTVLLLNANQTAGTDITVDDTGLRTITNGASDGTSAASPPLTGTPAWMGANALQKSTDAFDLLDVNSISYTETEYSSDLDVTGAKEFMLEFHVRFTANVGSPTQRVLAEAINSFNVRPFSIRVNDRTVQLFVNGSLIGDGPQIPINTWAHICVTRRANQWELYQDGIKTAVISYNAPQEADDEFKIRLQSHLEDQPIFDAIRMCKGPVYYDGFPSPTTEPQDIASDPEIGGRVITLMNAENGSPGTRPATDDLANPLNYNATTGGFENSNTGHTVEAGGKFAQGWFPGPTGSTEFPTYPNSTVYTENAYSMTLSQTKNCCLEGWIKARSQSSNEQLGIAYGTYSGTSTGIVYALGMYLYYNSSGSTWEVRFERADTSTYTTSISEIGTDWNHFALVMEDGEGRLYVNGTLANSWVGSFTVGTSSKMTTVVRANSSTSDYLQMGITDAVRFTMGSPVYTGNFTVPAGPPTTSIP